MANTPITFVYNGVNKRGQNVKGEISALSMLEAKNLLRRQGVSAKRIKKSPTPLFGLGAKKIVPNDISVMSRQIATMLGAGVSLVQTIDMIGRGHSNANMRKMLKEIGNEIKAGNPMSSALRKHPRQFDELYCDLVETGEQSGALETIYDRIAIYKEKAEALKSKIKKAMFYPLAVIVVAFIVTTILLIVVVPQFEEIFSSFGAELPAFTQFVLGISRFLQNNGIFVGAGLVGFAMFFKKMHQTSKAFRDSIDAKILKIPVIGGILKKAAVARFSRTLATTFAAGVPLISAL
ncbi:MAG: type IV pilus assembly protein PilC, partial [Paraglaciecola sp.]